jgi:hypothetical protein
MYQASELFLNGLAILLILCMIEVHLRYSKSVAKSVKEISEEQSVLRDKLVNMSIDYRRAAVDVSSSFKNQMQEIEMIHDFLGVQYEHVDKRDPSEGIKLVKMASRKKSKTGEKDK